MLQLDGLAQAADDLRCRGVDADYVLLYGPHGGVEGLEIADDFFPLWELMLPENQDAFERLDFAAIKARRCPGWSLDLARPSRDTVG
ncbi:MAG TPA: hypothetical protein VGS58_21655 [Candidatus Sulfopaludibacter sp.]|nr:hypothetical protein [Candidatus Sulfopaludibacter sp.]